MRGKARFLPPAIGLGLAALIAILLLLALLGRPRPTAGDGDVTFPPDLPTLAPSRSVVDATDQLPTPTPPQSAELACVASPPVVAPGQGFQVQITELGSWYGSHRWYELSGFEGFQQFDLEDGAAGPRVVYEGAAPAGGNWTFSLWMRDWDVHGTRPGLPGVPQTMRPDGTMHEASCAGALEVLFSE